jgi:ATP-dependent RNA helicase HelY
VEGHAVVLWQPGTDPMEVAGLAGTRTYPLNSSFRPSYNMAVNLVGQMGRPAARSLLESSFAQFQADRGVAGLVAQLRRNERTLAEYLTRMHCDRGDFAEYMQLRQTLGEREAAIARDGARSRRGAVTASLEALRTGDVIHVPAGRRAGLAVVLDPGVHPRDDPRPLVLTERRWAGRLSVVDFPVAVESIGTVRVPRRFNHRSPQERRDLASALRAVAVPPSPHRGRRAAAGEPDPQVAALRAAVRAHPCHSCPDRDEHARWAERRTRLERENAGLARRIEGRTDSLGRTFDEICALLDQRGYLAGDETTPAGRRLARIWSESDLVVAECLRDGAWDALDPAELAAVVSTLVYEPRREDQHGERMPTVAVRDALAATTRIWGDIVEDETELGLKGMREPELGFVWPAFRWARQQSLDRALHGSGEAPSPDLSAGDFVRWCKQVLDLLEQIATAPIEPGSPVAERARAAVRAVRRGVVAQNMIS